jgi:hypothetical protein
MQQQQQQQQQQHSSVHNNSGIKKEENDIQSQESVPSFDLTVPIPYPAQLNTIWLLPVQWHLLHHIVCPQRLFVFQKQLTFGLNRKLADLRQHSVCRLPVLLTLNKASIKEFTKHFILQLLYPLRAVSTCVMSYDLRFDMRLYMRWHATARESRVRVRHMPTQAPNRKSNRGSNRR